MTGDAQLAHAVRRLVKRYLDQLQPERKSGVVTATAPLAVRFPGDADGTIISEKASGFTPALNDTVVVERIGSSWVAVYAIVGA